MAVFGNIGEFTVDQDNDWSEYEDRLKQYFLANDIDNVGKKRAILLSVVGAQAYYLLRKLCAPAKPSEKTLV